MEMGEVDEMSARGKDAWKGWLVDLYSRYGTISKVAESLHISRQTLWMHMRMNGVTLRQVKDGVMAKMAEAVTSE